ncbi:MAG: hypothetical protein ABSA69_03595 [Verrucomicrobiota bacterium]|jgi:hypothetical protein
MKMIFAHFEHGLHAMGGGIGLSILALILLFLLTILPRVEKPDGKK